MNRAHGALVVAALLLAGCATAVSSSSSTSTSANQGVVVTHTLHLGIAPIAGVGVQIAPVATASGQAGLIVTGHLTPQGTTTLQPAGSTPPAALKEPNPITIGHATCPPAPLGMACRIPR